MKKKIRALLNSIQNKYYRYVGYYPANIHGYNFKLNCENFIFWKAVSKGGWEPETFKVLSQFLNTNSNYIDIGAWIGPTVIYAAKKCKSVICFEPDPVAYRLLLSNILLNKLDNVSPYNVAVSDKSSIQKMSSFGGSLGDSMTSLLHNNKNPALSFNALVLDWNFIENIYKLKKVDMIKIDVEGAEFSLIPQLDGFFKKHRPIVWLSIHLPFLDEDRKLEALQKIIDVMTKYYKICLNSNFEEININEMKNEKTFNSFPAFLFKN